MKYLVTLICLFTLMTPAVAETQQPAAVDTQEPAIADTQAPADANPCKGMADGEIMGVEVCEECHAEQVTGMLTNPHGQAADARTPFAAHGCESCHGPGTTHFDVEGNCIISLRGRFGETVKMRNQICLVCHDSDVTHWDGSTHAAEDLACVAAAGADHIQGFFIAKPMPAEDFLRWSLATRGKRQIA